MRKLVILLVCTVTLAVIASESDFSRNILFPKPDAYTWRRALGIDTNSYITTNGITNIIIAGTNITFTYSNSSIIINSAGATNTSASGITNIILTSTNLIISGSPMSGGGGTFTVDLPFLTNWFTDTNMFRLATNVMLDTNTFRVWTNTLIIVDTNLLADTNMFRSATNRYKTMSYEGTNSWLRGVTNSATITVTTNSGTSIVSLTGANTNLLIDTNTFRQFTNTYLSSITNQPNVTVVMLNPVTQRRWRHYEATLLDFNGTYDDLSQTGTTARQTATSTNNNGMRYTSGATIGNLAEVHTDTTPIVAGKNFYIALKYRLNTTNVLNFFAGITSGTTAQMTNYHPASVDYAGWASYTTTTTNDTDFRTQWMYISGSSVTGTQARAAGGAIDTAFHKIEIRERTAAAQWDFYFDGSLFATAVAGTFPATGTAMNIRIQVATLEAVAKAIDIENFYIEYDP